MYARPVLSRNALSVRSRPALPAAAVGADITTVTPVEATPPPSGMSDTTRTLLIAGGVVLVGGLAYMGFRHWQREEDRIDKMSPAERHQYDMDKLKQSVAYGVMGIADHALVNR